MAEHEKFQYRNLQELQAAVRRLGLDLPATEDPSVLSTPARLGKRTLANRLVVHPMEGCDGTEDGAPDELTFRRYDRWATGGAGLIWFEATAVVPEGRANPRQLWLHAGSVGRFAELLARLHRRAGEAGTRPVVIIQLTHSGRYSRPGARPAPILAHHNPILDRLLGLGPDHPLIADDQLDALPAAYVRAAELAAEAGFDGVDVKACHRYLVNELLAARIRPGRYGGRYENRTRLLRDIVAGLRDAVGDRLEIACRMNVYDGLPHPVGWGVAESSATEAQQPDGPFRPPEPDLTEPLRLVGELLGLGLTCLSVTGGNPYFRPHLNRPADGVESTAPAPPEHPLEGVARLVELAGQVQRAYPLLPVVGAGMSYLRQYAANVAAGAIASGRAALMGLGRGALAYPDFAGDLVMRGALSPQKVCIACGRCSQMMRDGGPAGCVVRDAGVYGPIYQANRRKERGAAGLPGRRTGDR